MVKTRSQLKIAFPRRKPKSGSKSEETSLESNTVKSCCIATLSRVRRGKAKRTEFSEERLREESSSAKKKRSNSDASNRVSHRISDVEEYTTTLRSRRNLNFDSVEEGNGPIREATSCKSKQKLRNKANHEVFKCSPKNKSIKVPSVQIELADSPEKFGKDIALDDVFCNESPLKYTGKEVSSSNFLSITSQHQQRRHSSGSLPESSQLRKKVNNASLLIHLENKSHSAPNSPVSTIIKGKLLSSPRVKNVTVKRKLKYEEKAVSIENYQRVDDQHGRRHSSGLVPDNGEKATSSEKINTLNATSQHEKRHSSGSTSDHPKLQKKTDNEKILHSTSRSPYPTPRKAKQSLSSYGLENVTPNRKLLYVGKQDGQLYKKAKHVLHSSIPGSLLCRENEIKHIGTFLRSHLVHTCPGSLYISGAPGTGKTACLTQILEKLQKNGMDCHIQFINCMNLSRSHRIFSKITEELTGWDKLTNKEAQKFLEKKFTTKGSPIVLVLDEIDQLESKNQDVLYTMFEWPSLPSSRLILIGIANALDLTDRVLPRLQLRPECKPQLLHFSPYTKDQIVKILTARLSEVEGSSIVDVSAVQFCARKIAAVSGDMRKALDICRRAVEIVEAEVKRQQILKPVDIPHSPKKAVPKKVTIAHVSKVISEVYGSRIVNSCGGEQPTIPLQQRLLICTTLLLQKESKLREIPVGQLHETYCKICKKRQVSPISQEDCLALCNLLETRGIISMKRAKETRMAKVSLKIDEKEVDHALQDKILLSSILQEGLAK